jgi:hypothetical protein
MHPSQIERLRIPGYARSIGYSKIRIRRKKRSVLQLTMLALAFVVMASFEIFAPTHEVLANPAVVSEIDDTITVDNPCTPEDDQITGTYHVRGVVHEHPGELLIPE